MQRIAINDIEIPEAAILAEMQYHPAASPEAAQQQAALALAIRELLMQEAGRQGLATDDEGMDALLRREVRVPDADEASCRRYFEGNRRRFRSPDMVEAQHILIAAAPDDVEARATAAEKAARLLSEVEREPSRLADLAREHSDCPSASSGGHLGQLTRGSTVAEFETFLFSLDEGEICARPVESRYGFHVVRLLRRVEGRDLPFEHVQERIREYLQEAAWRRGVSQYIRLLAGGARIEGVDLEPSLSPLVQ